MAGVSNQRINGSLSQLLICAASMVAHAQSAGGGLAFGAGRATVFVEARYHSVSTSGERFSQSITTRGDRFTFVPASLGILF
jgi:hypothetical protein